MEKINEVYQKTNRKERIIQFGEGNFLRAFADWMIDDMNKKGIYDGSVVIVQPIEKGMCHVLEQQDCIYTHISRGIENGKEKVEKHVIDCISRCVNPYQNYQEYLKLAENPDFQIIISNTTEAGIAYVPEEKPEAAVPVSFPAKITALLYRRYQVGLNGFFFLPCELIDKNGEKLKEAVLQYAADWNLGKSFETWVQKENDFYNTLVDRIVTGFPKEEDLGLPYQDDLTVASELFHLWVIEGDERLKEVLPFHQTDLHVVMTDRLSDYRTRKVRILNGSHTAMSACGLSDGFSTVGEVMKNDRMRKFIETIIFEEIIPTLDLPEKELISYAKDVLERFENPFIRHQLSSIALNAVSKFKVRVLPTVLEYKKRFGKYPENLLKAFSCLLSLYRTGKDVNDSPEVLQSLSGSSLKEALSKAELWGEDLSFLAEVMEKNADS